MAGAVVLVVAAALMIWWRVGIRQDEASLASRWFGSLLTGNVGSSHDVVYFSWEHGSLVGMRITSECTVALLTSPLCLLGAVMLLFARARWHRLLIGLLVALLTVTVVNQLRLLLIAVAMQHWGMSGYDVSHKLVGTIIALAGFVAGVLAMLKIATAGTPRRATTHE